MALCIVKTNTSSIYTLTFNPAAVWIYLQVSFTTTVFEKNVPGHTTRAPPVGFELETNSIQF